MKPLIHIRNPAESAGYYDKCISTSPNGLVYALSWYMDIICPDWEILATEDYSAVMPLPLSRSLGRVILRQPDYAWQLGVFSTRIPSPQVIQHFLHSIPSGYRLKKLCLSKFNTVPSNKARFQNSAELDLIRPYGLIRSRFGTSIQTRLELAAENSLSYVANVSVHDMLMFAYKLDRFNKHRLNPGEISKLRLIATNAIRFRAGQIGAAYDSHNNLCATALFITFRGRVSILHAAASSEGMAFGGIEYLIDRFIEMNAEQNLVLCADNPSDRNLMNIMKSCGSGISQYPCLSRIS